MSFENLRIQQLIVHKLGITSKNHQTAETLSQAVTVLPPNGAATLQKRLTDALAAGSQCVEVSVKDFTVGSTFQHAANLCYVPESDFIKSSQDLASRLTQVQTSGSIKSGLLIVMTGTCGANSQHKVSILLKAENDSGFTAIDQPNAIFLQFIDNLFLTPSQRLYKIGAFKEIATTAAIDSGRNPDDFEVFVFDHLLTGSAQGPAQYFYRSFLGCEKSPNSKQLTRDFFKYTTDFIQGLGIPDDDKVDYVQNLTAYLRSKTQTVLVDDFSTQYFDPSMADEFSKFMGANGYPLTAVSKDTSLIQANLKTRRIKFDSKVRITGPSEDFKNLVEIVDFQNGWTNIRVKGRIEDQT